MKNNSKQHDLDLITPLLEFFTFVIKILFTLLKDLFVFLMHRFILKTPKIEKINYKGIHSKRKTQNDLDLGVDVQRRKVIKLTDLDYKRHTLISGATGTGKTNLLSLLQEHSLSQNRPIIFFDPKGDSESLKNFTLMCKKYNRDYLIFLDNHPDSIKLNPLIEGSVTQIIDRIMTSFPWGSEPYYQECARASLLTVLNKLKSRGAVISFESILGELKLIENKDILGLINKIELICESDFGQILNGYKTDWTLSKVRSQKKCLYIGLSVLAYSEMAKAIGKIFINELSFNAFTAHRSLDARNRLDNPVSIYFDEFGSLITNEFIELFNKCRDVGMEVTMAIQSPEDIAKVNDHLLIQIIDNVNNIFILKQRSDKSAAFYANAIGTIETFKETNVIQDGELQGKGSIRSANELISHPDIIKNLNIGQAILLRQAPTSVQLVNLRSRKGGDDAINKSVTVKPKVIHQSYF